jgi:hypothetical protein
VVLRSKDCVLSLVWLTYETEGRRRVVLERASTVIFARMLAAMDELATGTFIEGYLLDDHMAERVPPDMVGRTLTSAEIKKLFERFAPA